jgi:hypothetical protein
VESSGPAWPRPALRRAAAVVQQGRIVAPGQGLPRGRVELLGPGAAGHDAVGMLAVGHAQVVGDVAAAQDQHAFVAQRGQVAAHGVLVGGGLVVVDRELEHGHVGLRAMSAERLKFASFCSTDRSTPQRVIARGASQHVHDLAEQNFQAASPVDRRHFNGLLRPPPRRRGTDGDARHLSHAKLATTRAAEDDVQHGATNAAHWAHKTWPAALDGNPYGALLGGLRAHHAQPLVDLARNPATCAMAHVEGFALADLDAADSEGLAGRAAVVGEDRRVGDR